MTHLAQTPAALKWLDTINMCLCITITRYFDANEYTESCYTKTSAAIKVVQYDWYFKIVGGFHLKTESLGMVLKAC